MHRHSLKVYGVRDVFGNCVRVDQFRFNEALIREKLPRNLDSTIFFHKSARLSDKRSNRL